MSDVIDTAAGEQLQKEPRVFCLFVCLFVCLNECIKMQMGYPENVPGFSIKLRV